MSLFINVERINKKQKGKKTEPSKFAWLECYSVMICGIRSGLTKSGMVWLLTI